MLLPNYIENDKITMNKQFYLKRNQAKLKPQAKLALLESIVHFNII